MRAALLVAVLAVACTPRPERRPDSARPDSARPEIMSGDLLFQDLDCGPLCDAIEGVTTGVRGSRLSHVAIAEREADGAVFVVEAYDGVARIPLARFLSRSSGRYVQARLRPPLRPLAERAVAAAKRRLGRPYDPLFRLGDERYYCSELIREAFREANGGTDIFPPAPMGFGDPNGVQDAWWAVWRRYFDARGVPVPRGEPGVNPGAISRSEALEIIHFDP